LGMPHGTACNRLRKMVLFDLLRRHGENVCFKCGGTIETAEELSIEHKQPWEGISTELFWSPDNIAFSHLRCNKNHRHKSGGASRRKVGPEGTAWCRNCKAFLPLFAFSRHALRWNGLQPWCNDCYERRRTQAKASPESK
ncbi:MAG TPA: HNH endonuclease, partial [Pyrinomonadaceae bacterium]